MGRGRPPNVPPPRPQRKGALAASIPCVGIFGNGRACQRCGLAVEEHDPAGNVADTLIEMVNSGHLSHEAVRRMLDEVTPIPSGAVEVSYPDGMNVKYASPSPYAAVSPGRPTPTRSTWASACSGSSWTVTATTWSPA